MEHEKPNAKQSSNRGNSWESRENQFMEIRVTTGEREAITIGIRANKENKVEARICNILTKVWNIERACHWLFFSDKLAAHQVLFQIQVVLHFFVNLVK